MAQRKKQATSSADKSLFEDKTNNKSKNESEDKSNIQKFQELTEADQNEYKYQLIHQKAVLKALYRLKEEEKLKYLQAMEFVKQKELEEIQKIEIKYHNLKIHLTKDKRQELEEAMEQIQRVKMEIFELEAQSRNGKVCDSAQHK